MDPFPSLDSFSFPSHGEIPSPWLESPKDVSVASMGYDYGFPSIVGEGFNQTWPTSFNSAGPGDMNLDLSMGQMEIMSDFTNTYEPKEMSRSTSTSSLSSINSNANLLIQLPDFPTVASQTHSRHSSFSSLADIEHNFVNTPPRATPKLELQTQGLGRNGRMRSSSRVTPYDVRQRSESVSEKSDDLSSLISSATSQHYQTPFTTTPLTGLNGFNRMSLQHRRSASNVGSSVHPMLSRKHRSSSLLHSAPAPKEREESIRQRLATAADDLNKLPSVSQQDKARSAWVKRWLQYSYTVSPGHTVPRQGLYHSYTLSCEEFGVRAINSASFGKAVRNAFQGIKTRRLGVRGNSKYHYVAIRPALSIEAERLNEFGDSSGQWHYVRENGTMGFQANNEEIEEFSDEEDASDENISPIRPPILRRHTAAAISPVTPVTPIAVYNLPTFPVPGPNLDLGPGFPKDATPPCWNAFCRQQEAIIASIRALQFDRIEINCREFWCNMPPAWVQVCHHPLVSQMITDGMSTTYNHAVNVLLEMIHMSLSPATQQSLRALADRLEATIESCLSIFSRDFSETKIELSSRAAHLFVRCSQLQQLSTALAPIVSNPSQVSQMLASWDRLDLQSLSDQCALTCNCQQDLVEGTLHSFRDWLADVESDVLACPLERLGQWVDKATRDISIKSIVPRAGFVTSQVMRDFTLKSDPTFGLFQLLKTWIDDWLCISALRQTVLSSQSVSPIEPNMSVLIPKNPLDIKDDLSTAMPFLSRHNPDYSFYNGNAS